MSTLSNECLPSDVVERDEIPGKGEKGLRVVRERRLRSCHHRRERTYLDAHKRYPEEDGTRLLSVSAAGEWIADD